MLYYSNVVISLHSGKQHIFIVITKLLFCNILHNSIANHNLLFFKNGMYLALLPYNTKTIQLCIYWKREKSQNQSIIKN
jgi:hypothetical protein